MSHRPRAGACTWCGARGPFPPRDHVFPRSLGGALRLAVPSCSHCDGKLRRLEHRSETLRLVSKVALGAAACILGPDALRTPSLDGIRAFIRDGAISGDSPPARQIPPGKELAAFPDHHLAIVKRCHGLARVVVFLSGYCYEVSLGRIHGDDLTGAAVSRRDGRATLLIPPTESGELLRVVWIAISANQD